MKAMTKIVAAIVIAGPAALASNNVHAWWNDDHHYDRWRDGPWYGGYPHGWGGYPGYGWGGYPGYGWGGYGGYGWGGYPPYGWGGYPAVIVGGYPAQVQTTPSEPAKTRTIE